jgi:hypothetical protein
MTTLPAGSWDLAQRAADRIVGRAAPRAVAQGVLAQWVAEQGWVTSWARHNPGNLAERWVHALGFPYTVHMPNPQPGNPIVTFATDGLGADCYARGLVTFDRYSSAVAAARAGDGLLFAVRVCQAGYGTRESTVRNVYDQLRAPAIPTPGSTSGGSNVAIRYSPITSTGSRVRLPKGTPLYDRPGGVRVSATSAQVDVPHVGLAGRAGGVPWRAVLVGTRWSYADGRPHPTVLYVKSANLEVHPA